MHSKGLLFILLICHIGNGLAQSNQQDQVQNIFSEYLDETRIIEVSLPTDYDLSHKLYPVLYLLDGEYIFEYAKGAVSFLSNPFGYLPNMIIVSIPNTDRNRDLFVNLKPDGTYLDFTNFIRHELIPLIDDRYRTNGFNILYGWSSGSGICSYFLAEHPGLFDGYIESGTAIGNKFAELLSDKIPQNDYTGKFLYANTEGAKYLNTLGKGPRVTAFQKFENLIQEIKPEGLSSKFEVEEHLNHVSVMTNALYNGLRFIFADFYLPDSITIQGADQIISYFEKVNDNYDFRIELPFGAISESAFILLQEGKEDEALKLLTYGLGIYPESADLHGTLAELYEHKGDLPSATKFYKKAYEMADYDAKLHLKYKTLYYKLLNGEKQ